MIFDGIEAKMVCRDCGFKFRRIVGTGPACPTARLVDQILKKNPPACPACRSKNVAREPSVLGLFGGLFD